MLRSLILAGVAFAGTACLAQYDSVRVVTSKRVITKADVPSQVVYDNTILQRPAVFPGGEDALVRHFAATVKAPEAGTGAPQRGTAEITFIVETDGTVNEVQVSKGVHPDVDKAILRAALAMPNWSPATVKQEPVRVRVVRAVTFGS